MQNIDNQKLLGVYIDTHLTWKAHIDTTCRKLATKLFLLKRIQYFLTPETKVLFYNAYITPIIDYACVTWQKANVSDINRIVKLQKRCARIILNASLKESSESLFKSLKWLTFPNRCKYFTGILIFKSLHNLAPKYIKERIEFTENKDYDLRSNFKKAITHKRPKTNYRKKTFTYSSMEIWDEIPVNIRLVSNINTFKATFKSFLFEHCQY